MLKGMQPQRDDGGSRIGVPDSEYTAFLAELVVVEWMRCQH
jgi:hypothetical protein